MPSTTSWARLEPRSRDAEMRDALQGRVHDPLWLLTRQWQVGEFAAQDAGTPVSARCRIEAAPLTAYRPGPATASNSAAVHSYDHRAGPLETLAEREPTGTSDGAAAIEAGAYFLRLLRTAGLEHYAAAYRERHPLAEPDADRLHTDSRRLLAVTAGRVVDGIGLHTEMAALPLHTDGTPAELPDEPEVEGTDREALSVVVGRWLRWYAATYPPGSSGEADAWIAERMEHRFAVGARTRDGGELVAEAAAYPGGYLEWDAFDLVPDAVLEDESVDAAVPDDVVATAVPAPVHYPGMPASRWWAFEDARTDFGAVQTATQDLASLMFIDLALGGADDWYLLPVSLEVGTLCRVQSLVVTDSFGQRTMLRPYHAVDGPEAAWGMFDVGGSDSPGQTLFLPPTPARTLHGPALEEVLFRRDEFANLGWAIERRAPDALGIPTQRPSDPSDGPPEPNAIVDTSFVYRLTTDVPSNWAPFLPKTASDATKGRWSRGELIAATPPTCHGRLLRDEQLQIREEEVPRSGVRITRRVEYTRWSDGSTHLWSARRKQTGGGTAWSGLRFDVVEPASPV